MLWLPLGAGILWLKKIPWAYPLAPDHKLLLLLPLYLVAPIAVDVLRRFSPGTTWADYGLFGPAAFVQAMALGFSVALLGVTLWLGGQWLLGWRRWSYPPQNSQGRPPWSLLGALLALTLFISGVEELVFRGVLINGMVSALPWAATVLLASLVFALSHLVWDGPAGVPQLPGLGLMGLVLILACWATGGALGLAWGLHGGWIFAIALNDTWHLTEPDPNAPTWLIGRPDQPLTDLGALGLLLLTGIGIWGYAHGMGAAVGLG
ncbi:MAG TPA: CPBP family intramembrane metalloprotease [Leptolyngbyaceae cyanobacterium M65_K2018_010]|nr:CPBP family intramembrane metalloprotease [Leptolyngbyaceae cyanobacterium M65_K2018_010]